MSKTKIDMKGKKKKQSIFDLFTTFFGNRFFIDQRKKNSEIRKNKKNLKKGRRKEYFPPFQNNETKKKRLKFAVPLIHRKNLGLYQAAFIFGFALISILIASIITTNILRQRDVAQATGGTIQFLNTQGSGSPTMTNPSVTLIKSTESSSPVQVTYTITGGTAVNGLDYTLPTTEVVTFQPGERFLSLPLKILDIQQSEPKTIIISLSNPSNGTIGTISEFTYTINKTFTEPDYYPGGLFDNEMDSQLPISENLTLHLRSTDGVTVQNGKVTGWVNQVNGSNINQTDTNRQPTLSQNRINGYPAIDFNNNSFLTGAISTISGPTTIFTVVKDNNESGFYSGTDNLVQLSSSGGTETLILRQNSLNLQLYANSTTSNGPSFSYGNAGYQIITGTASNSSRQLFVDGSLIASNTTSVTLNQASNITIGGLSSGSFSDSEFAEILVYNGVLSTQDRISVECYLSQKYALSAGGCIPKAPKIWLDPTYGTGTNVDSTPVGQWGNKMRNSQTITQTNANTTHRPTYRSSIINGNPVIRFNRTTPNQQRLDIQTIEEWYSGSIFSVQRTNIEFDTFSGSSRVISEPVSNRIGSATVSGSPNYSQTLPNSLNQFGILTWNHLGSGIGFDFYQNGTQYGSRGSTGRYNFNRIGQTTSVSTAGSEADVAEIIFYETPLNSAERTLVNNYLSSKFNIGTSDDRYSMEAFAPHQVAGAINVSGSNLNLGGYSGGMRVIASEASLQDTESVLIGNSGGVPGLTDNDLSSNHLLRWNRVWGLTKTGSADATLVFDFDRFNQGSPSNFLNYKLLYRSGTSGDFSEVPVVASLNGNKIEFNLTNTDLLDGYYTLATTSLTSPLGIDSIPPTNLNAIAGNEEATLTWTAPNRDVSDYIIQYSNDGFVNQVITFDDGVNSNTAVTVTNLKSGPNYSFRVIAVTQNNQSSTSEVATASLTPSFQSFTPDNGTIEGGETVTLNVSNVSRGGYLKPIQLTNSGNEISQYSQKITINTAELIASGKMRSDCGDLRILHRDKFTELPYYIESGCDTSSTDVWFKPSVIPSGISTFYMYYGNPTITSNEQPENVFQFFDEFDGSSINTSNWTVNNNTGFSVSNGLLTGTNTTGKITSNQSFSDPLIFEARVNPTFYPSGGLMTIMALNTVSSNSVGWGASTTALHPFRNGVASSIGSPPTGSQYIFSVISPGAGSTTFRINDANTGSNIQNLSYSGSFGVSNEFITLGTRIDGVSTGLTYNVSWDWIRVRPFAQAEPTFQLGTELSLGANPQVIFGSVQATILSVSPTQITVRTPAQNPAVVNVNLVIGSDSYSSGSNFTYTGPILNSISQSSGPAGGGNVVTLTGQNLTRGLYKREVILSNPTGSTIINAEVPIQISTKELIDQEKLNSNCSDIRFVQLDLTTSIPYWIESGCNTDQTLIWLRIASLPTGSSSLFMTHGNSNLSSESSITPFSFSGLLSTTTSASTWLRANSFSGSANDNDYITTWTDSGTRGNSVSQTSPPRQPQFRLKSTNNLPALDFDGSADLLTGSAASNFVNDNAYSAFAVIKPETVETNGTNQNGKLIYGDNNNFFGLVSDKSPIEFRKFNFSTAYQTVTTSGVLSEAQLIKTSKTSTQIEISRNGETPVATTSGNIGQLTSSFVVGGSTVSDNHFNGEISELVIFNSVLSSQDSAIIENYLNSKYRLHSLTTIPSARLSDETYSPQVFFGLNPAEFIRYNSNTSIEVRVPEGVGTVDVSLVYSQSITSTLEDAYSYIQPTITSLSQTNGPNIGGTQITIEGERLDGIDDTYTRIIRVTNPTAQQSGFKGMVKINTRELINASKMRLDCGDIRVRDSDNITNLSIWIDGCNTSYTLVWFNLPNLPSEGKHIYLSYGDLTLGSTSSLSSVFPSLTSNSISGWFRANDGTAEEMPGTDVYFWRDFSGKNNHLTAQIYTAQPPLLYTNRANDLPAINFNGANEQLTTGLSSTLISSNEYTAFSVFRPDIIRTNQGSEASIWDNDTIWADRNSNIGLILRSSGNAHAFNNSSGLGYHSINDNTVQTGQTQLYTTRLSNNQMSISKNGGNFSSRSSGNNESLTGTSYFVGRGSNRYFRGDISEKIFANATLSQSEIDEINTYLAVKYNLNPDSLPQASLGREQRFNVQIGGQPVFDAELISANTVRGFTPPGTGTGQVAFSTGNTTESDQLSVFQYGANTTPNQVTNVELTQGNLQFLVEWDIPNYNGASITNYTLQYSTDSSFSQNVITQDVGTSTSASLSGLQNGTQYFVRIRAVNSTGNGEWSAPIGGTPSLYNTRLLTHNPIIYNRMNETSGTAMLDSSGRGFNGTYTSGVTFGQVGALAGDLDTSVSFSGTQRAQVNSNTTLNVEDNWTLTAWFNSTRSPMTFNQGIMTKANFGGDIGIFDMRINSEARFQGSVVLGSVTHDCISTQTLLSNTWYFGTVTFDERNNSLKCYLNGDLVNNTSTNIRYNSNSNQPYYLACTNGLSGCINSFQGRIDEPAYFNKTFTDQEIKDLYYTGITGVVTTVAQININNGTCTPASQVIGLNTVNCTFPLTGGSGNYILPLGGDTRAAIDTTTGTSNLCTITGSVLTCNNLPTLNGSAGIQAVRVTIPGETTPPQKGSVTLITPVIGTAIDTPLISSQSEILKPISLTGGNLTNGTQVDIQFTGSSQVINGLFLEQGNGDLTDTISTSSFSASSYGGLAQPSALFNNNTTNEGSSSWQSAEGFPQWIEVNFGASNQRVINRFVLYPRSSSFLSRLPNLTLLQYFDGTEWKTAGTFNVQQTADSQEFTLNSLHASSRWRVYVESGHGTELNFAELEFFGPNQVFIPNSGSLLPNDAAIGSNTATLSSQSATPQSVPYTIGSGRAKAQSAPNQDQPIYDEFTVSSSRLSVTSPLYVNQPTYITLSGLVDSGHDLPLNGAECSFTITGPNSYNQNFTDITARDGECQLSLEGSALPLVSGIYQVSVSVEGNNGSPTTLIVPDINFTTVMDVFLQNGLIPGTVTTNNDSLPIVTNQQLTISSPVIRRENNVTNLDSGIACRNILQINSLSPVITNGTINNFGQCVTNVSGNDITETGSATLKTEVSLFNTDFNPLYTFETATRQKEVKPAPNSSICVETFRDDNSNGVRDVGEPLLGSVNVRLLNSSLTQIASFNSNATSVETNCFSSQFDGLYYVEQTRPANGTTTIPAGNQSIPRQSVNLGVDDTQTLTFGYNGNAQICPTPTFIDENENGTYQSSIDSLLSGRTVRLYRSDDLTTPISTLTTNGTTNSPCFTNISPGDYILEQDVPNGASPSTGTAVNNGAQVQRSVTLNFGTNSNTNPFGFIFSTSSLAKPQNPPNESKPVNSGIQLETIVNPTYVNQSFVNYPVTARILGLIDSGTDEPLNGTGICTVTFSGPSFSSPVIISNKDVVNGVCEVNNSDSVIPLVTGNVNQVIFQVTGPTSTLASDPYNFDVTGGGVDICVRPFADYDGNGTRSTQEPYLSGIEHVLSTNSGATILQTIQSNSLGTACFNPVEPGEEYTLTQTAPTGGVLTSGALIQTINPFPEDTVTYDYGYQGNSSITPITFRDDNRNGINDTEPQLNGIFTVTLRDPLNNIIGTPLTINNTDSFSNLLPSQVLGGNYSLVISGSSLSIENTTNNSTANVTLQSGLNTQVLFGYANNADICPNPIFYDVSNDGVRQTTEPLINDLSTRLIRVSDNTIISTIQASQSNCFNNVIPGDYIIEQDAPSGGILTTGNTVTGGVSQGTQSGGPGTTAQFPIAMPFGTNQTVTFGYTGNATICPYPTFEDRNKNGIKDVSEPDISGLTTELRNAGNVLIQSISTNNTACFINILPVSYTISQSAPLNTTSTTGGNTRSVTVTSGQTVDISFGYDGTPTICPSIFRDDNENGVKETSEPRLGGVTVFLRNGDGTTTFESIISASNSDLCFSTPIQIGSDYQVSVQTQPAFTLIGANSYTYTNVGFGQRLIPSFGFNGNATICVTHSFRDSDTDGSFDSGELLYENLVTELRRSGSSTIIQTINSPAGNGSNNQFCFNPVSPGNYSVTQTPPSGGVSTTGGQTQTLSLAASETKNVIYGYTGSGTICTDVFNDSNFDTELDLDESRIQGITFNIYSTSDLINPISTLISSTSNETCVQNLFPDTYRITVTNPPADFNPTTTGGNEQDITIGASGGISQVGFGYTNNPDFLLGSLSGFVYVDRNENGTFDSFGEDELEITVFDNDVPLVEQEVKLYRLNTSSGQYQEIRSQITELDGTFSFDALQPGTYKAIIPNVLGTEAVLPQVLASPTLEGAQETPAFEVVTNEKSRNNVFSVQYTARICPNLFVDKNNNSIFEPNGDDDNPSTTFDNDINLLDTANGNPGAYFQLRYQSFNGTQTASDGNTNGFLINSANPCINNIPPRDYDVIFRSDLATQLNYRSIFDTSFYNLVTQTPSLTIFLGSDESPQFRYFTNFAINNALSTVSGRVFNDRLTYGDFDPNGEDNQTGRSNGTDFDYDNDFPYENAELELFKCDHGLNEDNDDIEAWNLNPPTTFTASDGTYSFTNIPPGAYAILSVGTIDDNVDYLRSNVCDNIGGNFNYIFWNNRFDRSGGITPGTAVENYDIRLSYNNRINTIMYYDQNLDGQYNNWETNGRSEDVEGVYELRTSSDNDVDENSNDDFFYVPNDSYDVELISNNSPYPPVSVPQLTKSDVVINGGTTDLHYGFTPTTNSTLNGRVFIDKDKDRSFEPNGNDNNPLTTFDNDIPLANQTIEFSYGRILNAGPVFATVTTDINGEYVVSSISEGYYSARITSLPPTGLQCERCDWGYNNVNRVDTVYVERDSIETQFLTYSYDSSISINAFYDTISNGVRDDEWEIDTNHIQFTLTSTDGYIIGPYLANSNLSEIENFPSGQYTLTFTNIPSEISLHSNFSNPLIITVDSGEDLVLDYPFTPFTNNTLEGLLFVDKTTINGDFEPNGEDNNPTTLFDNELVPVGSTILITGPLGAYSTTVQANGQYTFQNLPSGRYRLHTFDSSDTSNSNPIPDIVISSEYAGNITDVCIDAIACKIFYDGNTNWRWVNGITINAVKDGITLERGDTVENNYTYVYTNKLRMQCIDDLNGNGQITTYPERGYTESAISGCNFEFVTPEGETITSTPGSNLIRNHLPPGNYTIRKTSNAAGRVNINTQRYEPPTINYGNVDEIEFTFQSGSLFQSSFYNFFQFETVITNNASITGKVFIDRNDDGFYQPNGADGNPDTLEDNDLLLNGINITVSGDQSRQTRTNNTGRYQVTDLPAGEYDVTTDLKQR